MGKKKIICTLGPASSSEKTIRRMMLAGMDVVRLNFSHSKPQELSGKIKLVRILNAKYRRRIKILGDLQGHRIRIGALKAPVELKKRKVIWLVQKDIKGEGDKIPFGYFGSLVGIRKGHNIFIDDGNICLEVIGRGKYSLKAKVISGGLLKSHKGINIPQAKLDFGGMSLKDKEDILFCVKEGVDYIAQSFVRSAGDIIDVRKTMGSSSELKVIAKIECREGIKNIDEIIEVSDGIMIARGDMGVSLPIYEIPVIQKMIIRKCNRAGKIVITATQMLESMIDNLRPTRAEVSDVANAVIDGTDFVMLSAESAVGKYPVEAVCMMNNIIKYTEAYLKVRPGNQ